MISIQGCESVDFIEQMQGNKGDWAKIQFENGLNFACFSDTAIARAQMAKDEEKPLCFVGKLDSREWNGKFYPNIVIETAWVATDITDKKHSAKVDKIHKAVKEEKEEDLPF